MDQKDFGENHTGDRYASGSLDFLFAILGSKGKREKGKRRRERRKGGGGGNCSGVVIKKASCHLNLDGPI